MQFTYAITRTPGKEFSQGITTSKFGIPSYDKMRDQHEAYVKTLERLGLEVINLEALSGYPDAYFVEDTAVVLPEIAVITRPGAPERRGEETSIAEVLTQYKKTTQIDAPGTMDGGDILVVYKHAFVGISERTNPEGARQFGVSLEKFGYSWTTVPLAAGLHLKSSVNYVGKNTLLISEDFADIAAFKAFEKIIIDKDEEYAANTLLVNEHLIMPAGFPKTRAKLARLGMEIIELDVSEAQKMDGGLTCMSLRF